MKSFFVLVRTGYPSHRDGSQLSVDIMIKGFCWRKVKWPRITRIEWECKRIISDENRAQKSPSISLVSNNRLLKENTKWTLTARNQYFCRTSQFFLLCMPESCPAFSQIQKTWFWCRNSRVFPQISNPVVFWNNQDSNQISTLQLSNRVPWWLVNLQPYLLLHNIAFEIIKSK